MKGWADHSGDREPIPTCPRLPVFQEPFSEGTKATLAQGVIQCGPLATQGRSGSRHLLTKHRPKSLQNLKWTLLYISVLAKV